MMADAETLWRAAMERMAMLNKIMSHAPLSLSIPPWKRHQLRAVAESHLNDYFDQIERMIAHNLKANTAGDRKRVATNRYRY
jgi:hypothetical protein